MRRSTAHRVPSSADGPPVTEPREPQYRYGVVFLIILALVIFEIVAPSDDWARAVATALAGAALLVAVATWRTSAPIHRRLILLVAIAVAVMIALIASGAFPDALAPAAVTLFVLGIPITLARGLLRLVAERGATVQALAGGLSIYLMLGLLFASLIGFVAEVQSRPFFTQGSDVSVGDRVYYSFTVMTTTGLGDYTAATATGHALAVLEMLAGQIYLVTVIGVLIGHYVRRQP